MFLTPLKFQKKVLVSGQPSAGLSGPRLLPHMNVSLEARDGDMGGQVQEGVWGRPGRCSGISPPTSMGWNSVICPQPPAREIGKFHRLTTQVKEEMCVVIASNICHMKLLIIICFFMHVKKQ